MQIEVKKYIVYNYCVQQLLNIKEFRKEHKILDDLLFKSVTLDKIPHITFIRNRFTDEVNQYLPDVNELDVRISLLCGMCSVGLPHKSNQGNEHIKDKVLLTEDDYILLYRKVVQVNELRKRIQSFTFEIESEVKASVTGTREIQNG